MELVVLLYLNTSTHIPKRTHSQDNTLIHRWWSWLCCSTCSTMTPPSSSSLPWEAPSLSTYGRFFFPFYFYLFPLLLLFISPFFFEIHIFLCYFFNLHFYFVLFCSVKFYFYFFIKWCRAVTKLVRAWTLFLRYFSFLFNFLFIYIYINFT